MLIKVATKNMQEIVKKITQETIDKIYPYYYPFGAVNFFKKHHSDDNIGADIDNGNVYLLFDKDNPIATVTVIDNHILRLFVLDEHQHKGYGKMLLDFAEKKISDNNYSEIYIDASFSAKHIYLKRGYVDREYHRIQTDNGDYLCYDVMVKKL